jgi:hypothetical protein
MFLSLAFPNLVFPSAILKVTPQGPMPQRPGAPRGEAALNSCSVPRSISRRPLPVPGFGRQGSQTFQIRAWAPIVFGLYSRVIHSGWDRPAVQGAVRREVTPSLSRRQGDRQSYKGVGYSSHIRPHNSPRHVRPSHVPRSHVPRSIGRRHMAAVTWPVVARSCAEVCPSHVAPRRPRRSCALEDSVRCNAGRFAASESVAAPMVQNLFTNPLTRITVEIS